MAGRAGLWNREGRVLRANRAEPRILSAGGPSPQSRPLHFGRSPERQLQLAGVGWGVCPCLGGESYLGGALPAKGLRASRDRAWASLARSLPARWMIHSLCS